MQQNQHQLTTGIQQQQQHQMDDMDDFFAFPLTTTDGSTATSTSENLIPKSCCKTHFFCKVVKNQKKKLMFQCEMLK
jgi:hypothetical protein